METAGSTCTDTDGPDAIIARMLGDTAVFFSEYWQKKPLISRAADPAGWIDYGADQFIADLAATQKAPYGAVHTAHGERVDRYYPDEQALRDAVRDRSVCAVKLSRSWHGDVPAGWLAMRELYASLCRAVAMLYMTPERSEDVDLFFAGPRSCLGTHFDTTEVFTLQLTGERRWLVEDGFSLEGILEVGRDPGWYPTRELSFSGQVQEIILKPGDALYVPAYTIHRVEGGSENSVSLSLGLRAYNEIDVVEHLLHGLRTKSYLRYPPIRGLPAGLGDEHVDAKLDLLRRVRALLGDVEGLATELVLQPMTFPDQQVGSA